MKKLAFVSLIVAILLSFCGCAREPTLHLAGTWEWTCNDWDDEPTDMFITIEDPTKGNRNGTVTMTLEEDGMSVIAWVGTYTPYYEDYNPLYEIPSHQWESEFTDPDFELVSDFGKEAIFGNETSHTFYYDGEDLVLRFDDTDGNCYFLCFDRAGKPGEGSLS